MRCAGCGDAAVALRRALACLLLAALTAIPAVAAAQGTPVSGAPAAVELPRDEGPHATGIEWWYFTGHLLSDRAARYGFELVIFRARQGELEGYVSHFAITDTPRGRFRYDQRLVGGQGVTGRTAAVDLDVDGWRVRGGNGAFVLAAEMPGYALRLDVATTKPAALHEGDGYIEYGNGAASYYYSWTRLAASGQLQIDGEAIPVTGTAWMDHQWGDFAIYREGGWDWFAIQLDDGRDVMLYVIRDPRGQSVIFDGSIVAADGHLTILEEGDFAIAPMGEWTSDATGTTYPSGWHIAIPAIDLDLVITPTLPDQELDTRPTTGVIYWEGDAVVTGEQRGQPVTGNAYVELTGYAPYTPIEIATPAV